MKKRPIHWIAVIAAMVIAFPAPGRTAENQGISQEGQNPVSQAPAIRAKSANSSDEPAGVPQLNIETGRYEFGSVVEGTPVVHDFIVKNRGNAPLIIQEVKTT